MLETQNWCKDFESRNKVTEPIDLERSRWIESNKTALIQHQHTMPQSVAVARPCAVSKIHGLDCSLFSFPNV